MLIAAGIVVAATILGPGLLAGPPESPPEYPEYDVSSLVPERLSADGTISVEPAADRGTVLIDRAHGNRIDAADIESLTAAIAAAGYEVEFLEPGDSVSEALGRVDAFVVIDPAQRYTGAQLDRLEWFVDAGGRLLLIGEPTQARLTSGLSAASIRTATNMLDHVASRFGFDFGEGYLYHMSESDGNYRNVLGLATTGDGVAAGIDRIATYTATHVSADGGESLVVAAEGTRSIRGDVPGTYGLVVRKGDVLAIGDSTFLSGETVRVLDNEVLVGNIVEFLVSGDRRQSVFDYPGILDDTPRIRYTAPSLLTAAQTLGRDLRTTGKQPRLTLSQGEIDPHATDVLLTTFDRLQDLDGLETGITVRENGVALESYRGGSTDLAIVRSPEGPLDMIIVADTPDRVEFAADLAVDRLLFRYITANSTAVIE